MKKKTSTLQFSHADEIICIVYGEWDGGYKDDGYKEQCDFRFDLFFSFSFRNIFSF